MNNLYLLNKELRVRTIGKFGSTPEVQRLMSKTNADLQMSTGRHFELLNSRYRQLKQWREGKEMRLLKDKKYKDFLLNEDMKARLRVDKHAVFRDYFKRAQI